jgi:hypothetical protein
VTNEIQAWTDADLAYRIVLLKTLLDMVTREFRETKALAAEQYPKGASIPARTDEDVKLGRVTKSDPKPVAEVVDADALSAHIRAHFPDKLDSVIELADLGEVLPVLQAAGRDDLFTMTESVPEWLVKQLLSAAVAGQSIPGVRVRRPEGVVSARAEFAAETVVRQLLNAGPVPLIRGIEG